MDAKKQDTHNGKVDFNAKKTNSKSKRGKKHKLSTLFLTLLSSTQGEFSYHLVEIFTLTMYYKVFAMNMGPSACKTCFRSTRMILEQEQFFL